MIENKFDIRRQIFRVWGPIPGGKKGLHEEKKQFFSPFQLLKKFILDIPQK